VSKTNFKIKYRRFWVQPFVDKGIVVRTYGNANEFTDKNGYRLIKDDVGNKHPISHIIYAAGCAYVLGYVKSYTNMKNFTIRYKDGDKSNCNFDNLICIPKKVYIQKLKRNKEKAEMWR